MLVDVALPLILAFIMFSLGLGLKGADFSRVLKFPKAFGVGLANQLLLLPVVGFALATVFKLPPELAVGLMILACAPGGVTTNVLTRIAGGNIPLSISMTAVTSLVSILTVPLVVVWSVRHFMGEAANDVDIAKLGAIMFLLTAVPVLLGMLVTRSAPGFVAKAGTAISRVGIGLFALIVIAAVASNWGVVSANFPALGPALILLNVILLGLGLLSAKLLGLGTRDATTISIESGVQNGTLGITVGKIVAGAAATTAAAATGASEVLPTLTVPSAVYSLVMYAVTVPFVLWRMRKSANASTSRPEESLS